MQTWYLPIPMFYLLKNLVKHPVLIACYLIILLYESASCLLYAEADTVQSF